jgi:Xaa-Pro aminopeptidase
MILSNEPGYYKPSEYGIRIENLVLVHRCSIAGSERDMLCFETLTAVPIDRSLLDLALLSQEECSWLNAYHARVAETVGPLLEGDARFWLLDATRAIA